MTDRPGARENELKPVSGESLVRNWVVRGGCWSGGFPNQAGKCPGTEKTKKVVILPKWGGGTK